MSNPQRAEWARVGLDAFAKVSRRARSERDLHNDFLLEEVTARYLCALLHLLGAERMERCLDRARTEYRFEITEDV
jgi:hypothetical protein